jgi:hypothetical protein
MEGKKVRDKRLKYNKIIMKNLKRKKKKRLKKTI